MAVIALERLADRTKAKDTDFDAVLEDIHTAKVVATALEGFVTSDPLPWKRKPGYMTRSWSWTRSTIISVELSLFVPTVRLCLQEAQNCNVFVNDKLLTAIVVLCLFLCRLRIRRPCNSARYTTGTLLTWYTEIFIPLANQPLATVCHARVRGCTECRCTDHARSPPAPDILVDVIW